MVAVPYEDSYRLWTAKSDNDNSKSEICVYCVKVKYNFHCEIQNLILFFISLKKDLRNASILVIVVLDVFIMIIMIQFGLVLLIIFLVLILR